MTVQELIDELSNLNPDAKVHLSYNYGDHWRTQVAPEVRNVEPGAVKHSAYHRMDVIDEGAEDVEDCGDFDHAHVIIS